MMVSDMDMCIVNTMKLFGQMVRWFRGNFFKDMLAGGDEYLS